MPFTLLDDENYLRTQRELAALGPSAVAVLKRYLAGAPAAEVPAPMVHAAYDILDRLGLVKQSSFGFSVPVPPAGIERPDAADHEGAGAASGQ
jgi:hypothetical protein